MDKSSQDFNWFTNMKWKCDDMSIWWTWNMIKWPFSELALSWNLRFCKHASWWVVGLFTINFSWYGLFTTDCSLHTVHHILFITWTIHHRLFTTDCSQRGLFIKRPVHQTDYSPYGLFITMQLHHKDFYLQLLFYFYFYFLKTISAKIFFINSP